MKIISGGQTGVDRGALDAAIGLGIAHGGYCPLGRLAEDGRIPDCYELDQTDSSDYRVRTERNVLEADATLILCRGLTKRGTKEAAPSGATGVSPVHGQDARGTLRHRAIYSRSRLVGGFTRQAARFAGLTGPPLPP